MKKTEKILGIIFLLALILGLFNIPGHSLLIAISASILAIIYSYLSFALFNDIPLKRIFKKDAYKGVTKWRILGTIWLGFGLSALLVGILFKLQNFPGARINMISGLIAIASVLVVAVIKFFRTKKEIYKGIILRIVMIGGLGLLLLSTNEMTVFKIRYRNHPTYIQAYENYLKDKDNKDLWYKLEKERYKYVYKGEDYESYFKHDYPEYINE